MNLSAIDETVAALQSLGRLEDVDAATVEAARSLAVAVDEQPGNASLWREYQAAVRSLREVGADDGTGHDIDAIIAAIRGDAPVGDAKN